MRVEIDVPELANAVLTVVPEMPVPIPATSSTVRAQDTATMFGAAVTFVQATAAGTLHIDTRTMPPLGLVRVVVPTGSHQLCPSSAIENESPWLAAVCRQATMAYSQCPGVMVTEACVDRTAGGVLALPLTGLA